MLNHLSRRALLAAPALLLPACGRTQPVGPSAPIAALNEALLAAMRSGRATPFAQRAAALAPVVARSFDLPAILQASVGPPFAGLSADDKAALLAAFTRYTVATYVANFDTDSGERFTIDPATRAVGAEQVVTTDIVPASGAPVRLDYVVRQGKQGWQAVDVLVDGSISRVAVQRSDFRSLLAGGVRTLIGSLDAKADKLANGDKS